jgi:hypothetical protein
VQHRAPHTAAEQTGGVSQLAAYEIDDRVVASAKDHPYDLVAATLEKLDDDAVAPGVNR